MWILYALLTAVCLATSDALTKKILVGRDEYFVAWARMLFSVPLLLAVLLYTEIPPLNADFWAATAIALPLEIITVILYTKALKASPLSLTMPFLALTPLFLIVISYLVTGERISASGAAGIALMALGSYMLNLHKVRQSFTEPFRSLLKEKGCILMMIVAFIYSFTSSLGKVAISNSSPVFFGSFYYLLMTVLFTPVMMLKNSGRGSITRRDLLPLTVIGITQAMMIIFHMLAMSMTKVAYMISVKRTSLLFSVLYGYLLFREEKISEKALGAAVMFAGFVIIVLGRG